MAELIDLRGAELGNTPKNRSRRSSALTSRKKSGYNAVSSDRARRISTRSPPRIISCNSLKFKSPLTGIGPTGASSAAVTNDWLTGIVGKVASFLQQPIADIKTRPPSGRIAKCWPEPKEAQ